MIPHNPSEILAVVDDDDNVIGKERRDVIHQKGLVHREVWLYLVQDGKFLLQKRVDNNKWDCTVGGHFPYDQDYDEAAIRETKEEIGLDITEKNLQRIAKLRNNYDFITHKNNNFGFLYMLKDVDVSMIKKDDGEIIELKFFTKEEALKLDLTKTCRRMLEEYF